MKYLQSIQLALTLKNNNLYLKVPEEMNVSIINMLCNNILVVRSCSMILFRYLSKIIMVE